MDSRSTSTRRGRACLECNARKLRCLPSEETPEICRRCYRTGRECVLPGERPRRPKVPLVGRVEQLERRLSSMEKTLTNMERALTSLANNNNTTPSLASTEPDMAEETSMSTAELIKAPSIVTSNDNQHIHDVIDLKFLSLEQADILCRNYREFAHPNFPYIILSQDCTASYLRIHKPMLLLIILAVTSWRERSLQLALEQEYLKNLSHRLLIRGEKSLDLLQSLLVYVGWCHHFSTSQRQLSHRLYTLAVNTLVELGYDQEPKEPRNNQIHGTSPSAALSPQQRSQQLSDSSSHEIKRALIGCYALTTWSLITCRQGYSLPWTTYIEQCGESLAANPEVPTDSLLQHYASLMHISESINTIRGYANDQRTRLSEEQIWIGVRCIENELRNWKSNLPFLLSENTFLDLTYDFLDAHIHSFLPDNKDSYTLPSRTRISLTNESFRAARAFFVKVLSRPTHVMAPWTSTTWGRLLSTFMLLRDLSREKCLFLDGQPLNISRRLQTLAGLLHSRVQELFLQTNTPPNQEHWLEQLSRKLENFHSSIFHQPGPGGSRMACGLSNHDSTSIQENSSTRHSPSDRGTLALADITDLDVPGSDWDGAFADFSTAFPNFLF